MSNIKNKPNLKISHLELANRNLELEISARKQIERSLKDKEDRFRTIFKHAPVAYFLCNLDGDFLDGNLAALQLTGYTNEELFGKNFIELNLIDKKNLSAVSEIILRCGRGENTGPDEFTITKKHGSNVIIEMSTSLVTVNEQKQILGIAHDITDRKESDINRQESEERFRKLFDSSHDALMTLNPPSWKFTSGNPAILDMFEIKSIEEFLTYGPWDISPETQPDGRLSSEKAKEMIEIAMNKGSNFFEWTHKRINGETFPATVLLTRIQLKDEFFLQATVKDITEQKKHEKGIQNNAFQRGKLLDIARELSSSLDFHYILYKINDQVLELLDSTSSTIYLLDSKKQFLIPVATHDLPYEKQVMSERIGVKSSLAGKVVKSKQGMIFNNASQNPDAYQIPGTSDDEDEHLMVLPLLNEKELFGTLNVYRRKKTYSKEDIELAETFSLYASTAIQNSQANQELVREINERKQIEQDLRQSEERFKRLFDGLGDAVYVTKIGGKNRGQILEVNLAAEIQTGYTRNELLNMNIIKDIYISGSGEIKTDDWEEKLSKGQMVRTTEKKRKKDGTEFWTDVIVTSLQFKGENAGLSINYDITERKNAENAIKKNESLLKSILDSTGDGLLVVDHKGRVTHRNNEFNKMWKIPSDLRNSTDDDKLIDFVLNQLRNPNQFISKVKELYNSSKSDLDILQFKDGRIFERYTQPLVDKKSVVGRVWSFRDITERKQAEEALKDNEEKYHSLTENLPLGIYRNTPGAKGKFIEVNQACIDMFCFKDRESFMAATVSSLYDSPNSRKQYGDKLERQGFVKNEELKLRRKDGSAFIASSTAIAVKDENGKVIHYDGIIEDITERAELRTKLLENEEKFRSIVSNSPCVIMQADRHGVISFVNYSYSGQEPANIIGKSFYSFMSNEFREVARNTIKKVFETGESYSFENLGFSSEESVVWYKNTISAIQKNNKVIAVAILAVDISDQKQSDLMKTEFISSVSHEIRTPITIVRESLSLLSDELFGKLNKAQAEIINPCIEDIDKLSRVISNLLDISRIEGQNIKLEREVVDIVKQTKGVVSFFRHQAERKNIELVFTSNRESINLYIDKDRIIQVFMNLIGNAIKFTEKGKIEVTITDKKDIVECCITDTGLGIEQKDLGTLFDNFHQVGRVMRAGEKRTGLGLSISKGIIKLHKGKIWVNSKLNKGSKFYFSLPQFNVEDIIMEQIEKDINEAKMKHTKLSLLLIRLNNYSEIESKFSVDKANKVTKLILKIIQDELAPGDFSFIKEKNNVILLSDITEQNINILISRLIDILAKSVLKIDKDLEFNISASHSIYPNDATNSSDLMKIARKRITE